jgi:hypothetical protein
VAVVALGTDVMDLLDATIVNVAALSIRRDLGGAASSIQWLSAGNILAFSVLLVAGGRVGDIISRRIETLIGFESSKAIRSVDGPARNARYERRRFPMRKRQWCLAFRHRHRAPASCLPRLPGRASEVCSVRVWSYITVADCSASRWAA